MKIALYLILLFIIATPAYSQVVITNSNFLLGKRNPWSRPHIRLVGTVARFNDYARDHNYPPFLQINQKRWGSYLE